MEGTLTSAFSLLLAPQLTWVLRGWGTGHEGTCIAGEQSRGKAYGEDRAIKGKRNLAEGEGDLQRQLLFFLILSPTAAGLRGKIQAEYNTPPALTPEL